MRNIVELMKTGYVCVCVCVCVCLVKLLKVVLLVFKVKGGH